MAKLTIKQSLVLALVIVILGGGITLQQMLDDGNWYYCGAENNLTQCDSLSKYGVPDAKCHFVNENGDNKSNICTVRGIRSPWLPLSDFTSIDISKANPIVISLQNCEVVNFSFLQTYKTTCYNWVENTSDCLKFDVNGSCKEYAFYNQSTICYEIRRVFSNETVCEPTGFQINYSSGKNYKISHNCCGYFEDSPYPQYSGSLISCKQKLAGICNPLIQQTSKDISIYDEVGKIYLITAESVKPVLLGGYPYVWNYDVDFGKLEVVK